MGTRVTELFLMLIGSLGTLINGPSPALPPPPKLIQQTVTVDARVQQAVAKGKTTVLIYMQRPTSLRGVTSLSREKKAAERVVFYNDLKTQTANIQSTVLKQLSALVKDKHLTVKQSFFIDNVIVADIDETALNQLRNTSGVTAIVPNYTIELPPLRPTASATPIWNIMKIGADRVWSDFGVNGNGITVGIIDSGVQWNHQAIKSSYRGWDGVTANHDYSWYDPSGSFPTEPTATSNHGTHVTGSIVGASDTVAFGVAPKAKWITALGCPYGGCPLSYLLSSGQWMLAPTKIGGGSPDPTKAPDIINNSWGGDPCRSDFDGMLSSWRSAGIIPVFSIGNNGPNGATAGTPGDHPNVLGVGATDDTDTIASFSSRGPTCSTYGGGIKPDVAAPGVAIYSSIPDNAFGTYSGTSMAAPHVSGAIALLLSADPTISFDTVKTLVESTARDLGASGKDNTYGAGRIDVYQAITSVIAGGKITGTIRERDFPTVIPNAHIAAKFVSSPKHAYVTDSDGSGNYTLSYVPAGNYSVRVTAFGYEPYEGTTTVAANQTVTLDASLIKLAGYTFSGTVTDENNNPLPATIKLTNTSLPLVYTNPYNGTFYFSSIPPGTYTVAVESPGFFAKTDTITLTAALNKHYSLQKLPSHVGTGEMLDLTVKPSIDGNRNVTFTVSGARISGISSLSGSYKYIEPHSPLPDYPVEYAIPVSFSIKDGIFTGTIQLPLTRGCMDLASGATYIASVCLGISAVSEYPANEQVGILGPNTRIPYTYENGVYQWYKFPTVSFDGIRASQYNIAKYVSITLPFDKNAYPYFTSTGYFRPTNYYWTDSTLDNTSSAIDLHPKMINTPSLSCNTSQWATLGIFSVLSPDLNALYYNLESAPAYSECLFTDGFSFDTIPGFNKIRNKYTSIVPFVGSTPTPTNTPTPTPVATPTNTPTPTPSPQPLNVTVVSPNGGEIIPLGSTYRITWNSSSNIDKVQIGYKTCDSCLTWITVGTVANTGYYDWIVNVPGTSTQVKIHIVGYQSGVGTANDTSDNYFTILKPTPTYTPTPTPTPYVRIIYPNGGEVFTDKQNVTILWESNKTDLISLYQQRESDGYQYPINTARADQGQVFWQAKALSPYVNNEYRIVIPREGVGNPTWDTSDAPFTILPPASPTPTPTPISCNSADINKDGIVNSSDLTILLVDYFKTNPTNPRSDIDGDGIVDVTDYSILVKAYNTSTGPCL